MLDVPTQQNQQLWVIRRLYRICLGLHNSAAVQPCLEQYERQVRLLMDQEVTAAASAWIQIIVQCLRTETEFRPETYMGTR